MKRLIALATATTFTLNTLILTSSSVAQSDAPDSAAEEDFGPPGSSIDEPIFVEPPPPSDAPLPPDFDSPADIDETGADPGVGSNAGTSVPRRVSTPRPPSQSTSGSNRSSGSASATKSTANKKKPDSERIQSFDFQNADIEEVVRAISQLTGKNFILDPNVKGKISVIAPTAVTVGEAYRAFLSALAINGYTVVPSGKFLKIMPARIAQRDSIEIYTKQTPNTDQMVTRIVSLKFITVQDVSRFLRTLSSKDGDMIGYEPTNSLIISDYSSNIRRIVKIINELDQPGFQEKMSVIPVRYAKAKDLADLVDKIINNKGGPSSRPGTPFRPGSFPIRQPAAAGGSGGPGEALSLVAPDDRTNSLIVVGNQEGIDKVKMLVEELDFNLDPSIGGGVFVYRLKHSTAENVANTLNGLVSKAGSAAGSAPQASANRPFNPASGSSIFGGDVKITPDKNTNSLIVVAGKQDYDVVKNLISKIDIPRDQVFVEAIIMEINAEKTRDWSVTNYYFDPDSNGSARAGYSPGNLLSLVDPRNDSGVVLGFGQGRTFQLDLPGLPNPVEIPSLLSLVKFLQTHTDANILSTPQILAMDNEEAMIEVGDKVPIGIQRQVTSGGVVSESPQFEQATIKLTITPHISPESNSITMLVNQSVKQPSQVQLPSALQNIATVISDRSLKTNIVVENEDTVILGGLIRDEEQHTVNKIPLLGDIPVIGWLFKSDRVTKKKINLVVFLTPRIIRNKSDSRLLLSKKLDERINWIKKNMLGDDPHRERVEGLRKPLISTKPSDPQQPSQDDPNLVPEQPQQPIQTGIEQSNPDTPLEIPLAVPPTDGTGGSNREPAGQSAPTNSGAQPAPVGEQQPTQPESEPLPAPTPAPLPNTGAMVDRRTRFGV